jgi:AcrR family transcriptional regulator
MTAKPRLNRTDWIKAGFRALNTGGPKAIRAEAIARDLEVSKGSFYWHFKNLADLQKAMINHWQDQATNAFIATVDQTGANAPDKLRHLFAMIAGDLADPYGGAGVEAAIRDWARYDTAVQTALYAVDAQRITYVQTLLAQSGHAKPDAKRNARLLYAALLGYQQIAYLDPAAPMKDLPQLLDLVLNESPA